MTEESQTEEQEVVDAKEIFLLMKDEYRISRNTRASWYLKNLNTNLTYKPKPSLDKNDEDDPFQPDIDQDARGVQDEFTEELEILSIIPRCAPSLRSQGGDEPDPLYRITPETKVAFLSRRYRLVFVLDVSPSIATVDVLGTGVLYDDMFLHLQTAIRSVIKPFYPPGSQILYKPMIYITVIAHTPVISCKANQVLVQGCILTEENVESLLEDIKRHLDSYEQRVAACLGTIIDHNCIYDADDEPLTGGLFEDIIERAESPEPGLFLMTPDASFTNMLRYGILSLQLLPENSSAGIVVITDGIVGLPDASLFESLMTQLRHNTIACSFMHVRAGYDVKLGLGNIAYPELMQFIATATFGAYFSKLPKVPDTRSDVNVFHQAFLTWGFQRALECFKLDDYTHITPEDVSKTLIWTHKLPAIARNKQDTWTTPMLRRKQAERNVHTPLSTLISCRLREGYTIKDVSITKGDSQIEIRLVLPWRHSVRIQYVATSVWPLNNAKRNTHVDVYIEASYDFLHDVTSPLKKAFKSPFRTAVVKKYWQTVQGMSETDQLLVHLQSFSTTADYYQVPEGLKQGIPLFYFPRNVNNVTQAGVNIQLSNKDTVLNQFASFWKPVLMLDVNIWQKWMHTHRIGLVLEHDVPLGTHLHVPNSSGRFHQVTCRQALTSLSFFLRDWGTFVLMENHSYIKFLYGDPDKPPTSFYVLRMASKPPCMVLRLAFLGGTSGRERNQIVNQLRDKLLELNFPHRGTQKDDKSKKAARRLSKHELAVGVGRGVRKPPLQRTWSEINCCVITQKPIEKILIRYERMPHDLSVLEMPPILDQSGHLTHVVSANKAASSVYTTLSRYLCHQRWIWSVQLGGSMPITMQAIGRILNNLTKIRLQESFNFAHTNAGIINLVTELEMKTPSPDEPEDSESGETFPCVMQYIVFPPHTTTTRESSISEEEIDEEVTEADGELQIITECWVEPQYGHVVNSLPERKHFDGLTYSQLPHALFPNDLECISTMVTFEHLNHMCQSCTVPSPNPLLVDPPFHQSAPNLISSDLEGEVTIHHLPFPFDLLGLLPKCQQVELLFSTYIQDHSNEPVGTKSRSGTLTRENVRNVLERVETFDITCPNNLLFSLLLSDLSDVHDREVHLTDFECLQLLSLIRERERSEDEHPLPFNYLIPEEVEMLGEVKGMEHRSESQASLATSFSVGSGFTAQSQTSNVTNVTSNLGSSLSGTQITSLSGKTPAAKTSASRVTSPPVETDSAAPSGGTPSLTDDRRRHASGSRHTSGAGEQHSRVEKRTPMWRCFIRSLNGTQLFLTFIPATFDDLKLLVKKDSTSSEAPDKSANEEKEDIKPTEQVSETISPTQPLSPTPECKAQFAMGESDKPIPTSPPGEAENDVGGEEAVEDDPPTDTPPTAKADGPSPPEPTSYNLPVYIYNCPLTDLSEQLVSRWTHQRSFDVYEDLQFKPDEFRPETPKEVSEELLHDDADDWRSESRRRGISGGSSTGEVYGEMEELKQHCTLVSETFFRCFVKGVYQSVKRSQTIDAHDVEAAINSICEESLPLEIDISRFLQAMCVHMREVIERVSLERISQEDMLRNFPKLEFSEEIQEQRGNSVVMFSMSDLKLRAKCEKNKHLHTLVRKKFSEIIQRFFVPVPSHPEFYFFSSTPGEDEDHREPMPGDLSGPNLGGSQNLPGNLPTEGPEFDMKVGQSDSSEFFISSDHESVLSNKNSMSMSSVDDLDESIEEVLEEDSPLFINLTCSVRCGRSLLKSIPVKNLPMCLAELKECVEDCDDADIDLNELQITLDVICLTLPPDEDLTEKPARPCYQRMTSYMSQMSATSVHSDAEEADDVGSLRPGSLMSPREVLSDPLSCLNNSQKASVINCQKQLDWLLKDEIASAMRKVVPVTEETLDMVSVHVKASVDKRMCIMEQVPLHFVYGPDQSLQHFVEDFERMNMPGYHMNKVGIYYYLYKDRAHACHMAHLREVSNKLESLEPEVKNTSLVADQEEHPPFVSNVASQQSLPDTSPEVYNTHRNTSKTETRAANTSTPEKPGVTQSPGVSQGKPSLTSTSSESARPSITSPEAERSFQTNVTSSQSAPMVLPSTASNISLQDDSIEILPPNYAPPLAPGSALTQQAVVVGDTFHAEDIRISVIRPSPVKEPLREAEEATVHDVTAGGLEEPRDDVSDRSSGSSIQVLDEQDDDTSSQEKKEQHPVKTPQLTSDASKGIRACGQTGVKDKHPSGEKIRRQSGDKPKHPSGERVKHALGERNEHSPGEKTIVLPAGSAKEKHPSGGSAKEKHPSGGSAKEKHPSGGAAKEKHPSGGSAKEKHPSGGSVREKHPSGGSVREKHPSGGSIREKHSSGGSIREKHSSGGSVGERHPSGGSLRDKHSSGESIRERHGSGGSLGRGSQTERVRQGGGSVERSPRRLARQKSVGEEVAVLAHQLSDDVFAQDGGEAPHVISPRRSLVDSSSTPQLRPRQLSPVPSSQETGGNIGLKRAHSSASFERYKHERTRSGGGLGSGRDTPQGRGTPQRRPSGHQGRLTLSGIQTPMSTIDTSSRGSYLEDGYDGEISDSDEEGVMMSLGESMIQHFKLPDFWLIMQIDKERVNVMFHTRDMEDGNVESEHLVQQRHLYNRVIKSVSDTCRIVNQKLLLEDLYGKRMCNPLLVPQADEELQWTMDKGFPGLTRKKVEDSEDSDGDAQHKEYLAAATKFMPGHFGCTCVWRHEFFLHPRLKTGTAGSITTRGIQALRKVLDRFTVSDRKNMFVIRETASGAVFYLRLDEQTEGAREPPSVPPSADAYKADTEFNWSISKSSSTMSLALRKAAEQQEEAEGIVPFSTHRPSVDLDSDAISVTTVRSSVTTAPRVRREETVILSAHGICDVGAEIHDGLVLMLQKKLDEAVLDILTVTLSRNPMSKLNPEDINFIQIPWSGPQRQLLFTIPHSVAMQKYALSYYLRQNMLQFLFTPKYTDSRQEVVFRDYSKSGFPVMLDDDVFLYNRGQQSGGKGIACIHLSFVDGVGNPIQMLACPRPSPHAYREGLDSGMFDSMVSTTIYNREPGTKGPGPTALIKFSIWERGSVNLPQLTDQLLLAIKHAISDIITEYRLLTSPICEPPSHYLKGRDTPMHSAPPSPTHTFLQSGADVRSAAPCSDKEPIRKQLSEHSNRTYTPHEKSTFSLSSIFSETFKVKPSSLGPPNEMELMSPESQKTWQEREGERRKRTELLQKIQKYEGGERGVLNSAIYSLLPEWFDFCLKIDVPTVAMTTQSVACRYPMEYVLKELPGLITNICADAAPRVFKYVEGLGEDGEYVPHYASSPRTPVTAESKGETSLDFSGSLATSPVPAGPTCPGKPPHYVMVARNIKQWRTSLDNGYSDKDGSDDSHFLTNPKTHKSYQKCRPLNDDAETDSGFVPRQRIMLLTSHDKKMTMYTYNWSGEMISSLERQFARLVQWHNARSHLLSCILLQKMGLFQHLTFGDLPTDPITQEGNPFTQNLQDLDLLVKVQTSPPFAQMKQRHRSGGVPTMRTNPHIPHLHPALPMFEDIYRDVTPTLPMHKSSYAGLRDPVHRHGAQLLEVKSLERKDFDRRTKLENLYISWQHTQRMGSSHHAHMPITEETLVLLKSSSRLVHSVVSPLLFSPQWRRQVMNVISPNKTTISKPKPEPVPEPTRARSRHSSGASIKSKRSDSMDSRKRPSSPELSSRPLRPHEEGWHSDLRANFVSQYIQYLHSLGFLQVQIRPPSPKRGALRPLKTTSTEKKRDERVGILPGYTYLQKTLPGGIMLIELGFREVFFCVRVHAFECSRLPVGKNVNPQLAVIFTDECDRFKDLTHVHSFTHDFHLRIVQTHISGRLQHVVFKQGYHLTGFLQDLVSHYSVAPSFARNYIQEGIVTIEKTNSSGHQLFDYMLSHDKLYKMRAIRMVPTSQDGSEPENEYALVTQFERKGVLEDKESMMANPDDYDVGLVIAHDAPSGARGLEIERTSLKLRYWVILTNKRDVFPKLKLEKKLGVFKSSSSRTFSARGYGIGEPIDQPSDSLDEEEESSHPLPVTQYMGVRRESVNYLGFSTHHQTPIYKLLVEEAKLADAKINEMVQSAMAQCRRDLLWQRMLLGDLAEDGRHKRRTGDDEGKEPFLTKLSFNEFHELLSIVTSTRLCEVDPQLSPLHNMSVSWYQGLARILMLKYTDSHRHFTSPDGLTQYVVVLNPNYLDTFMMLSVELLSNKADLCAVFREPLLNKDHSPDAPNLPALAMQNHVESFVNTCSFHMWGSIITQ